MSGSRWMRFVGGAFLLAGLLLLIYRFGLVQETVKSLSLSLSELLPIDAVQWQGVRSGNRLSPDDLPTYRLEVVWPAVIPWGEKGVVSLKLSQDNPDVSADTEAKGFEELSPGPPPVIQTRLELPGTQVMPNGEVSQAWSPYRGMYHSWNIRPQRDGRYEGTLWLHVRYQSAGQGQEATHLAAALPVELRSQSVLGLSGVQALVMAGIGMSVGIVLLGGSWISKR